MKLTSISTLTVAALTSMSVIAAPVPNYTDQILVKFSDKHENGNAAANRLSQAVGKSMTFVRTSGDWHVFRLPEAASNQAVETVAKAVMKRSGVQYAEPDRIMHKTNEPNDPLYSAYPQYLWHYRGPNENEVAGLNLLSSWSTLDLNATPVTVAVLDTGITAHPDLDPNIVPGYDAISYTSISNDGDGRDPDPSDPGDWYQADDSSWHGTHVAGTIAAVSDNNQGIAGVGYNLLKVMPVRVLGQGGGYTSDIAWGIDWVTNDGGQRRADVINMSLGGSGSCSPQGYYQQAITRAYDAGITVVVAAGNSNANASNYSPASCDNVISVAALTREGTRAYYSNYGNVVDIAAPGGDYTVPGNLSGWNPGLSTQAAGMILSTLNDGTQGPGNPNYTWYQGTSMAAPHVAALAGLAYVLKSDITPFEVESLLKQHSRSFVASCSGCGAGMADAELFLANIDMTVPPPPPSDPPPTDPVWSDLSADSNGVVTMTWFDSSWETGYELEMRKRQRKNRWTGYSSVDISIAADEQSYTHSPGDGTFMYRLRAVNDNGETSNWVESSQIEVSSGDDGGGSDGGSGKCHPKRGC
ncbi:S8 family peptidase [Neptuniibacter sp.]|uniref:S8 family peptidase n=1 Tax=Neptuniibacter sp. TaxID=1962643 RepID=UPI003B59A4EA